MARNRYVALYMDETVLVSRVRCTCGLETSTYSFKKKNKNNKKETTVIGRESQIKKEHSISPRHFFPSFSLSSSCSKIEGFVAIHEQNIFLSHMNF